MTKVEQCARAKGYVLYRALAFAYNMCVNSEITTRAQTGLCHGYTRPLKFQVEKYCNNIRAWIVPHNSIDRWLVQMHLCFSEATTSE